MYLAYNPSHIYCKAKYKGAYKEQKSRSLGSKQKRFKIIMLGRIMRWLILQKLVLKVLCLESKLDGYILFCKERKERRFDTFHQKYHMDDSESQD